MGEINTTHLGVALLLPPTPEGYTIFKPFELPTIPSDASELEEPGEKNLLPSHI